MNQILNTVKNILEKYDFKKIKTIVAGGRERYESVRNGLQMVTGDIVLIHDGARPLVDNEIIERCIVGAAAYDACVAGVPAKDTIKITKEDNIISDTPDRNNVWITQTPQAFKSELIKNAYNRIEKETNVNITDDAMVVEHYTNHEVRFVLGAYTNIKVTTPEDVSIVKVLLNSKD